MILYRLVCTDGHEFESWFRDSAAYDKQAKRGLLECPACGSHEVTKAIMAPAVSTGRKRNRDAGLADTSARMAALAAKVRDHVESKFDYVGPRFADEARAIHDGTAEDRGIYGEASAAEAMALIDDGIAVAPLPESPAKKAN